MAGEDCTISVPKFGTQKVKAEYVQHGINMFGVGVAEDESRAAKQFFTTHKTSGSFDLGVVFTKYTEYDRFMKWLERYTRWMADPRTPGGPARVTIPSRRFDKTGLLEEGIQYGDQVGKFVYRVELRFMGSRDPIDLGDGSLLSAFVGGREQALVRLYPTGSGLAPTHGWDNVGLTKDDDFGAGNPPRPISGGGKRPGR